METLFFAGPAGWFWWGWASWRCWVIWAFAPVRAFKPGGSTRHSRQGRRPEVPLFRIFRIFCLRLIHLSQSVVPGQGGNACQALFLLDALIYLEEKGVIPRAEGAYYSTRSETPPPPAEPLPVRPLCPKSEAESATEPIMLFKSSRSKSGPEKR